MDKQTVLVVEDEKPLARAIVSKLKEHDLNIVTANSVEGAEAHLDGGEQIDLIWLDHYLLGKESGLDLVRRLKEEGSAHKATPVVLVSNTASEDKVRSYLHLGVNKYFTKSNESLGTIVTDVLDLLHAE